MSTSKSKIRSLAEIDRLLADHWLWVDRLVDEAEKKGAYMKRLRQHEQVPLMIIDSPAAVWAMINEHYRTISILQELRLRLATRPKR